ncbi:MAG TPA: hypothetical protein VN578_19435 [Candidatus Binatia bacterium]|nr:hypothetical protein [Candidatus Binatia bacterium]
MRTKTTKQYPTKPGTKPGAGEHDSVPPAENSGEEFVQFELDGKMLAEVETLARATGCSRFEMCVTLLEEGVAETCGVCGV